MGYNQSALEILSMVVKRFRDNFYFFFHFCFCCSKSVINPLHRLESRWVITFPGLCWISRLIRMVIRLMPPDSSKNMLHKLSIQLERMRKVIEYTISKSENWPRSINIWWASRIVFFLWTIKLVSNSYRSIGSDDFSQEVLLNCLCW